MEQVLITLGGGGGGNSFDYVWWWKQFWLRLMVAVETVSIGFGGGGGASSDYAWWRCIYWGEVLRSITCLTQCVMRVLQSLHDEALLIEIVSTK